MRLTVPLPPCDPWALSHALKPLFGPTVARFCDAPGALTFAAWGMALAQHLPQTGRFNAARRALTRLQEGTITLGAPPAVEAPAALCVMAFESGPCGRPGAFAQVGGGLWVVPSCLVVQRGTAGPAGGTYAVLQALCGPSENRQVAQRLGRTADALLAILRGHKEAHTPPQGAPVALPPEQDADRDAFMQQVATGLRSLGPDLHKVVLARMRTLPWAIDPESTLWALRQEHPNCTAFDVRLPGGGHFLGATPETLVRLQGGQLRTEALAGTAPRGASPEADRAARDGLLQSQKDCGEHEAVVKGLRETLAPYVQDFEAAPKPGAKALRHMWHLHTPICAAVKEGVDALTLAAALHPTPALGGQPRALALAHLLRHEPWRRGLYAAPLGWVGLNGEGTIVAGIRSLYSGSKQTVLFAGAGVVFASTPQGEWQETVLKLTAAQHSLRMPAAT